MVAAGGAGRQLTTLDEGHTHAAEGEVVGQRAAGAASTNDENMRIVANMLDRLTVAPSGQPRIEETM